MTMTYRYLAKQPKKAATIGTASYPYSFTRAALAGNYIIVAGMLPGEGSTSTNRRGAYIGVMQIAPDGKSLEWVQYKNDGVTENVRPFGLRRNVPTPVQYSVTAPTDLHAHLTPAGDVYWGCGAPTPGITTASGANNNQYVYQHQEGVLFTGSHPDIGGQGGTNFPQIGSTLRYTGMYANGYPRFRTHRRAITTPIGSAEYYTSNTQTIYGLQQPRNNTYQSHTLHLLQVLTNEEVNWSVSHQVLAGATGNTTRWDIWMDRQTPGGGEQSPVYNCTGLPTMTDAEMRDAAYFFQDGVFFIAYGSWARSFAYQGAGVFVETAAVPISTLGRIRLCKLSGNRILLASSRPGSYVKFTPQTGVQPAGDQPAFPAVAWAGGHSSGNVFAIRQGGGTASNFEIFSIPE